MNGRYTTIMLTHEEKSKIDQMIGDTRRARGSFLMEAMEIREYLKGKGMLDKFLDTMKKEQI